MADIKKSPEKAAPVPIVERDEVTIRFAGDSGDGMQLAGAQLTTASAMAGNDVSTLPDFPAEIRAPAGTLAGVSGFQVRFSSHLIHTPGDVVNVLVAMNPAALQTNLRDLEPGGVAIVNADSFVNGDLQKAGYASNPLDDGSLKGYSVLAVPINKLNREAVGKIKLSPREADRCRNFFALGLVYWMFERPLEPTLRWVQEKFSSNPAMLEANSLALKGGYHYGEMAAALPVHYRIPKAPLPPGRYRKISGMEGLALGLVAATESAKLPLVFAASPSHPASEILHQLAELKHFDVRPVQAEDEIAALSMAVGASFGGALGATATSGPGLSLSAEGLGLAVMAELPCVLIDIQRGGPSTGLPTKTEQADLLAALFGRHGECPLPVLAASSAADAFTTTYEAVRLAIRYMTPVIVLADVYLANSAEPWRIPGAAELPAIGVSTADGVSAFDRDERLARAWIAPGTPGLEHRLSGLEKEQTTGKVSYDPANHEAMVRLRADKIARIAGEVPPLAVEGPESGDLLVVGWGSTHGAIASATKRARDQGRSVAGAHLRHLNPLPANTGDVLKRYKKVLVAELNQGQLLWLLRGKFLVDAIGYHKVQGKPFLIGELEAKIAELLRD